MVHTIESVKDTLQFDDRLLEKQSLAFLAIFFPSKTLKQIQTLQTFNKVYAI